MKTITRNNYTPAVGDYHNVIVYDETLGKIWLFDCDGIYTDLSKTNVTVVNEAGGSKEYAISQAYVTERFASTDKTIAQVDEDSQTRDTALSTQIANTEETLQLNLDTAVTNLEAADTTLANSITSLTDALRDDVEHLTDVSDNLTDLVNNINNTAVFDVSLNQETNITLSVTDGSTVKNTVLREASASQNGLMPATTYAQVVNNTQAIANLQAAGLYRGSFATLSAAPTTTPDDAFIGGECYNNDFITVQDATYGERTGVARYRASVSGSTVSYDFELFIDEDIQNFTEGNPGLIVGGTEDGTVAANTDGTGTVNGWADLKTEVTANTTNVATNTSDIATNKANIATNTSNISALDTRLSTAETTIASNTETITTNTTAIATNTTSINTLNNKPVEGTATTTLAANSENLLTTQGWLNHWVDITTSGLPDSPSADTFYYTVEG